jgi:hypothetical protein
MKFKDAAEAVGYTVFIGYFYVMELDNGGAE